MSPLPTPKVVDLDDPLTPRPTPASAPSAPPTEPAPRPKPTSATTSQKARTKRVTAPPAIAEPAPPSLGDEPRIAVFARLPESLSDRLAEGVAALNAGRRRGRGRVSQQDLLGALVERYVTPDDVAELGALVAEHRRRLQS